MNLTKVKFIQNPKSGMLRSARLVRKIIESSLVTAPFSYEFVETKYKGHAHYLAMEAKESGFDAVVAIGGDGTINEIATALLFSDVALGVIPAGSGNGLAHGFKIPLSILRATKILWEGEFHTIDAGFFEDKYFLVASGVGLDALIGKIFNDQSIRGPLPYFTIGIKEFIYYRPEIFTLIFDDKRISVPAMMVTVANTKGWGAGAIVAPLARPDDGLLDICILHRVTLWYAAVNFPKLFNGKIDKVRKYERYQTNRLQIIREKPGPFHVDGESHDGGQVLNISVIPKAIKLIVPKIKPKRKKFLPI
jgi:diacylglycerol kinase (ATP)